MSGQQRRFVVGEKEPRERRLVSNQHSQKCSREGVGMGAGRACQLDQSIMCLSL